MDPSKFPVKDDNKILVLDGSSGHIFTNFKDKKDDNPLWCAAFLSTDPEDCVKTHLDFLRVFVSIQRQMDLSKFPVKEENKIFVLDASIGHIFKNSKKEKDDNPLWCAAFLSTDPEACVKTHLDFLRAGSDVIETFTYQASVPGFAKYLGIGPQAAQCLIKDSVGLARRAIEIFQQENPNDLRTPLVAGSMGPYGAFLHDYSEYTGAYIDKTSPDVIKDFHRPRIEALREGGCDLLACETIPAESEALYLAQLLKEFPHLPAWFSFQCKDKEKIAHGELLGSTVPHVLEENPDQIIAVGMNCLSPSNVVPLLTSIPPINKPFIVYSNSGERYTDGNWIVDKDEILLKDFDISKWLDIGVRFIGGCCRTTPEDIIRIKSKVAHWQAEMQK